MNGNMTFWKKVGIVAGAIGAILGVMISWQSIEFLPRWAWYSEVAQVQDFAQDTRRIVMNQEWFRLTAALKEARVALAADPLNRELIEKVTRLEQQLRAVEEQLDALKKKGQ